MPRNFAPKIGKSIAVQWLYPSEEAQRVGCEALPIERRLLWGVLAREGMRDGSEATALTWCRGRTWKLDPSVTRALTKWKAIRYPEPDEKPPANALVLVDEIGAGWEGARFAEMFRADLQTAGVKRPELFEKVAGVRAPIRAHDLRSSFVTVKLAIGWTEAQISARTGHQSSQMIGRCRRVARTAEELDVGDVSPLDVLLFGAEETEDEVAAEESPAADPVPQPIVGLQSGPQDEPVQNTQPLCEDEGPSFPMERVVGQPGLEPGEPASIDQLPQTSEDDAASKASGSARHPVDAEASGPTFGPTSEVETALARALEGAAAAGRFDVVAQLARELEARRLARSPNVVPLNHGRGSRGTG